MNSAEVVTEDSSPPVDSDDRGTSAPALTVFRRWWPVAFSAVLALGLCIYQLSRPHVLRGLHGYSGNAYDDGVYFGTALRLIHGILPYRDYTFLHPPGIAILMAPVALLSKLIGTQNGLVIIRLITAGVATVNAGMAAFAVRSSGRVAMLVSGTALAVYPLAVTADHSLQLEPYLVTFCLLAVVVMFHRAAFAIPRRLFFAGVFLGVAGSIKVWAVLPAVVALAFCVSSWRSRLRPMILGLVTGFGVIALPFIALAPRTFLHDVIVAQLQRKTEGPGAFPVAQRLAMMFGLAGQSDAKQHAGIAVAVGVVFFVAVVARFTLGFRRQSILDWFLLANAGLVLVAMLRATEFADHYAYFPAAFLSMLLGTCVAGAVESVSGARPSPRWTSAITIAMSAVAGLALVGLLIHDARAADSFLAGADDPGSLVRSNVPTDGKCVLFDDPGILIAANRYGAVPKGCPVLVDPFGLWLIGNDEVPPPASPPFQAAFVDRWQSWLERADYVVLSVPFSNYIPWTPAMIGWFNDNYQLVASRDRAYVYVHAPRVLGAVTSSG